MRVRTFLNVAVWLAAFYVIVYGLMANADLVRQEFRLWGSTSLSVGWTLVLAFLIGVTLVMINGLAREAGLIFERWRLRKANRKHEEIEEEYSKGLAAVLEGRDDVALSHFRAVLERDSRHFNTLIKLGEVLRGQEKFDEAIEYHRKAHHLKEDSSRPLYALVEDYEAKGDMDRARAVLGKILALNKNSAAVWRKLRALHMKEGHWEKALEAHERVEKLGSSSNPQDVQDFRFGVGLRYEIACGHLAASKVREAISDLRRLVKDAEGFIPGHVKLGEALREAGQDAEAVQIWSNAFELTGSPIFLTALEEHFLAREQPLSAIEALKSCIARVRKDTLARFYLGKLYFRLEMLDDAHAVLASLAGRASYAPTLHYLLGRIHERRQKFREAVAEYRRVIREMQLVQLEYTCRSCGETVMEWSGRCGACGEWNTVEVNFREEIPLEDLGLAPAPIYTARA
jgi:lipopolysaccharide biosynthesis regulator YciM